MEHDYRRLRAAEGIDQNGLTPAGLRPSFHLADAQVREGVDEGMIEARVQERE